MPQNPIVPRPGGSQSVLNITAATVVKANPGTLFTVSVTTPGTAAGSVHDCATTGAATAANLVFGIPFAAAGVYTLTWPCLTGITITPGAGQVLSVSFA